MKNIPASKVSSVSECSALTAATGFLDNEDATVDSVHPEKRNKNCNDIKD
jgi:hypothetical protein